MAAKKLEQTPLQTLRAWLKKENLDGMLVPHENSFKGEFLPPQDERLAWLTGFTGSVGFSIVTLSKAILYVPTIYILQARYQVDTKQFDIVEMTVLNPFTTFQGIIKKNQKIAMDPWLYSVSDARRWIALIEAEQAKPVMVNKNPIDLLWQDRPRPSTIPAEEHALKYAGVSREEKIQNLIQKMNKDAARIFVSDPLLVCWLLNIRGRDVEHTPVLNASALVTRQGTVSVFVDLAKITPALKRAVSAKINFYALDDVLKHATNRHDTIQIDPVQCPLAIKQALDKAKISVVMADDPCLLLRAVKNKTEIKGAVEAHKKDAVAFKKFLAWFKKQDFVKTKITELDIVEKLRSFRAQDPDYIEDSFKTIAGYGSNGAVIHYKPTVKTNKVLRSGSLLLLDSGAQYRCGTTDITRVLPIGKPTPHMKACYQAVWKGLHQLQNTRFVYGTSGYQLDVIARKEVWQMGDDYGHGTGHGVGSFLSVHEGPQRFSTTTILQPGMILSIEPGLYYEGKFGIRLENLVVIEEDKRKGDVKRMLRFRLLTQVPFEKEMF